MKDKSGLIDSIIEFKIAILNLIGVNKIYCYEEESNVKNGFFKEFFVNNELIHIYKNNFFLNQYLINIKEIKSSTFLKHNLYINKNIRNNFFDLFLLLTIYLLKKLSYSRNLIFLISYNEGQIKIINSINIFDYESTNVPFLIKIRIIFKSIIYNIDLILNLQAIIEIQK